MANNIPISHGSGVSSVAAEQISTVKYQQIKVVGGETGSTSVWGITPDGSAKVSVIGTINVAGSVAAIVTGTPSISGAVTLTPTSVLGNAMPNPTVYNVGAWMVGFNSVNGVWDRVQVSRTNADGLGSHPNGDLVVQARGIWYNGTSWDRARGNTANGLLVQSGNASVFTVPTSSTIAVIQNSSILAVPVGSVITVWQNSSILSVPVGSTIAVLQSPSIVGTYAEDAAHATGDKGILALGVRNDTLSSVTSADGDYTPISTGPVGETVTANAPITKWVRGTADLRVVLGASVTAIAAQGASIFTYITSIQLANMGSASVLVTFTGGLGSILGYSIAPAGGGSNIYYPNALKTGENSAFAASISGTASVLVSAQGFTAKI